MKWIIKFALSRQARVSRGRPGRVSRPWAALLWAVAALFIILPAGPAGAQDYNHYWMGGPGDFEDITHWWCVATGWYWGFPPGELNSACYGYGIFTEPDTITFNGDHTNYRMYVGTGTATFDLNGHTYSLTRPSYGISVGDWPGYAANLLVWGGTLAGIHSCAGYAANASGTVCVTNPEGGPDSVLTSSLLCLGYAGSGHLIVLDGGYVVTTTGVLGQLPGSSGTAEVTGPGSYWYNEGWLYIGGDEDGPGGDGHVFVGDGGLLTSEAILLWETGRLTLQGGDVGTTALYCETGAVLELNDGELYIAGGPFAPNWQDLIIDGPNPSYLPALVLNSVGENWFRQMVVGGLNRGHLEIISSTAVRTEGQSFIGREPGSNGSVTVAYSDSLFYTDEELLVGEQGTGVVAIEYGGRVQSGDGGSHLASVLLGIEPTGDGTITIDDAGSVLAVTLDLVVGMGGRGHITQTDGAASVAGNLRLGKYSGSEGTYALDGGQLTVGSSATVGDQGTGTFLQTGGNVAIGDSLSLGVEGAGSYTLSGGDLSAAVESIGQSGSGIMMHSGGSNSVTGQLELGYAVSGAGTYNLSGTGVVSAQDEVVGVSGSGEFVQSGGTNTVTGQLQLGYAVSGAGTYNLSGTGAVSAQDEVVGVSGSGEFVQSGGTNTVSGSLAIGWEASGVGTYTITGGQLSAAELHVGHNGAGALHIADAAADVTVSELLRFGPNSSLACVPGGVIHMTGSALDIENIDPADMAGLENLTLIFEGGPADTDPVETAGQDMGAVSAGWVSNFALGTLQIGGVSPGNIRLVNARDNQPGWVGAEAMYVNWLVLNAGAKIDLNGLNLYYLNGGPAKQFFVGDASLDGKVDGGDYTLWADNYGQPGAWGDGDFNGDGITDGGDYTLWADNYGAGTTGSSVPEPGVLSALAVGALALIRRRR